MDLNDPSYRIIRKEIRLVLDEKKTAISLMSTGVVILIAQLVILSFLISTSQFYKIFEVLHIVIPFYIINFGCISSV